jgi:hypothetical protein
MNAQQLIDRARELLHTAADASKKLEQSVRELVTMRAWEVLGHKNFCEMWKSEHGYGCPPQAQIVAVDTLRQEGMTSDPLKNTKDGFTQTEVAAMVGVQPDVAGLIVKQLDHGVPISNVIRTRTSTEAFADHVNANGTVPYLPRKRPQPRRMGKAPHELVSISGRVERWMDDDIADIAREADVPKAEIVRQAVAEYLARHRASRPVTFSEAS